jgi:hypothetical protein
MRSFSRPSAREVRRDGVRAGFLHRFGALCFLAAGLLLGADPARADSKLSAVWANEGGDKVLRHERRAAAGSVTNSVWDGTTVRVFGARNETVNFNLVLESATGANDVSVSLTRLAGPNGALITSPSVPVKGDAVFNWVGRNIELFVVDYLQINGLSKLSYDTYDERHIPSKMRRPNIDSNGYATGVWGDRPGADKFFPEIAVPHELRPTFSVAANSNQSVWVDVYIPRLAAKGVYTGTISIREAGVETRRIPVALTVRDFTLPDDPSAKTMLAMGNYDISQRYTGNRWADPGTPEYTAVLPVLQKHWMMMKRHRVSPAEDVTRGVLPMPPTTVDRMKGTLYTRANGYDGPGVGRGDNVYPIGLYGNWTWKGADQATFNQRSNEWVTWFQNNARGVDYFLYLVDEPNPKDAGTFSQVNGWLDKLAANTGAGKQLRTFVTTSTPNVETYWPRINIAANWYAVADTAPFQSAVDKLMASPANAQFQYNGKRPASGSFATEDDGTSPRMLAWAQTKKKIGRWFFWESCYYYDYQTKGQQVDVWHNANTYGKDETVDPILGHTGYNHSNGDGVLFYPGTDKIFPASSLGLNGPIASLRLKYWRRGIEDADYIALARHVDATATDAIVARMVPKVLWEVGVNEASDPTWKRTDISWSVNPDDWETARKQLADIIEKGSKPKQPQIRISSGS